MRRPVCGGILGCAVLAASVAGAREKAATAPSKVAARPGDEATTLPVLHTTLRTIRDKYVEPSRIVPSELLVGALKQLERDLVPVVVSRDDATGVVVVRADDHTMSLTLSKVNGVWDVAARLREVFAFLRSVLKDQRSVALRDLEIAASKGLVESVDRDGDWLEGDGPRSAGLGIALSLRDGAISVERVVPGSAASRSGLKPQDLITQVDEKLVAEMTLDEALESLRGPVGSRVNLLVRRSAKGGGQREERLALRREAIAIAPMESRQLRPGIGYIRLKQIAAATADEISEVLGGFRQRGLLDGLVLDLRDNHGGLFAEATKIADAFLDEGSLALVQGRADGREERKARKDGNEPRCPLVILTSSSTASGSELIASALQKNERAVIVGERSLGAGRIQLVFPSAGDHTSIRLTIAEFQAPAGTSVDGVGVVPDIELRAARLDPSQPRFFGPPDRARARDRLHVFPDATPQKQPEATIWYASDADAPEKIDVGEQSPRHLESDFTLKLATDLVTQFPNGGRSKQVDSVRPFLERVREREMGALEAQLKAQGIDWRPRPGTARDGPQSSDFAVRVTTDRAQNTAPAGGTMTLMVAITNHARLPAYQVRAITNSQNADFDEKEMLFGYVAPGQTVTRSVAFGQCDRASASAAAGASSGATRRPCHLSLSPAPREDIVKIIFSAPSGEAPTRAELRPAITARSPAPSARAIAHAVAIEIGKLPLSYREEKIRISGQATGRDGLLDVRVIANGRKVLYRRATQSPAALPFEIDAPLAPGINVLRVVARDRNDVTTTRTFIVRRDGAQSQ